MLYLGSELEDDMINAKTDQPVKSDLSRVIQNEKAAMPKPATLELQKRPRPVTPRKMKAFLNIARGRKA